MPYSETTDNIALFMGVDVAAVQDAIPDELLDAARVDDSGEIRTFSPSPCR